MIAKNKRPCKILKLKSTLVAKRCGRPHSVFIVTLDFAVFAFPWNLPYKGQIPGREESKL